MWKQITRPANLKGWDYCDHCGTWRQDKGTRYYYRKTRPDTPSEGGE